jgi:hypothetical protein
VDRRSKQGDALEYRQQLRMNPIEFNPELNARLLTLLAWVAAVPVIAFMAYLLWRKFGPRRRHRRRGSRLRRYLGRS